MNNVPATLARVESSRMQMRSALEAIAHPAPGKHGSVAAKISSIGRKLPGLGLVVDSAKAAWRNHPMHGAAQVTGEASQMMARPIAQRHPVGLIVTGFAAGAVLFLLKPWRLALRPRYMLGAASLLGSQMLKRGLLTAWKQRLSGTANAVPTARTPQRPV
jgi:hypothetical protein